MSKILSILQIVNETVNDFTLKPKRNYTEPKIYTGGIEITKWSKYSKAEQQGALEKNWFVYFSFRNPKTGFLEKQPFIKGGVNRYKTKEERMEILETYRRNLLRILKEGYNPYDEKGTQNEIKSVKEAFAFALDIKKNMMTENSYIRFKSRIKQRHPRVACSYQYWSRSNQLPLSISVKPSTGRWYTYIHALPYGV